MFGGASSSIRVTPSSRLLIDTEAGPYDNQIGLYFDGGDMIMGTLVTEFIYQL